LFIIMSWAPSLPSGRAVGAGLPLVIATGLVMILGWIDDTRGVRPWHKVLVQALAGLILYAFGYRIDVLSNPSGVELGWLALPITLAWFVVMSNAFNLIDGLDGLATGIAVVSTMFLVV